jgi:hypothetical protein
MKLKPFVVLILVMGLVILGMGIGLLKTIG